ncbi:hypothetical protein C1H46_008132 [Malus baccata]|uniref:Importin subunit beta-1/Transportin-1-like TPR repeats domain-containing protein n=1 Tax=Malus baccata TaxID=106549 RepID=A0A540N6W5_MALBA|nr:hypothetical protein C1H46_008132 [Malus baccata]
MCPLLAESNDEDKDDDLAPDRAAAEVIDTMALNIPKHVFHPVFEFSSLSSKNANPKYREASVTALGVISEGCLEMIKDKLDPVLHIVLGALRDPEEMVRGAASFALGQFAEHLQPEIVSHYQSVLPCILNALEDAFDEVKEKSYYALAAFCDNMGEEILPFLDPLMGKLLGALHNSPHNLQETCMSAIGSVASAAEQAFVPYGFGVDESFLVLSNDEDLRSRARATELVGMVAIYYGDILRGLYPLFGESGPDDAVRDNAAGAVARMIMVHPESIPLNQVLPVFLKVLPLKEDREESMTVYSCVSTLVLSSNAQILFLVPDLVNVFAQVVASPVETPEVKAQIGRAFAHLISLYGQQMQPLLSNLSPAYANALAAFVPKS